MFPGVVAAPFASVKLGPDFAGDNARSGYNPTGNISGFSLLHMSGTGGSPKYGTVSQLPVLGAVTSNLSNSFSNRSSPDNGTVGYYATNLANGIKVELAGTDHVGYYQYTFPSGKGSPGIIVDVSHVLTSQAPKNLFQTYSKGNITIFPDGHYEGSGSYSGGWNLATEWTVYFCGHFSEAPVQVKTFSGTSVTTQALNSSQEVTSTDRVAAHFSFQSETVISRVGLSFISSAKACQFVESEMPDNITLTTLMNNSKSRWNSEVLSKVTTNEKNVTMLSQLYTSLYGMHLVPSNRTGENPNTKWNASEPYYDDFYTLWDTFRCTTTLFHILQPAMYEETIRSLIEIFKTDGYLPDGRSSNYNGRTQGGSNADNVLADAYVKGVRGEVDWNRAWDALYKDAEVTPPNNNDPLAKDSSTQQGRSALPDWLSFGLITTRFSRSVSRAVEYSVNDFALYQVAKGMGKSVAGTYLKRSRNWRNHFDHTIQSLGTSGFVVPRNPNFTFHHQDPLSCGGCYWADAYYQGKPWEYTVNAHHDIATLIKYDGNATKFVHRLDTLLDPKLAIADSGNQPSFGSPYLYNFVNQQARSVRASRSVATRSYGIGPKGLPGNSDAGSMQSWLLWNMIGLYPLTGQTTFLIQSPWFTDLTIDLGRGKTFVITSSGGDNKDAIYVQSLKVNGKSWNQNWLSWNDVFANGGTMEFVLGAEMKQWDTGALPPSPASDGDETGSRLGGLEASGQGFKPHDNTVKIAIGVGVACGVMFLCMIAAGLWFYRSRKISAYKSQEMNNSDAEAEMTDEKAVSNVRTNEEDQPHTCDDAEKGIDQKAGSKLA